MGELLNLVGLSTGRRALRDAARDGGPGRARARRPRPIRSAAARHLGPRARLEPVRAARVRAPQGRHRRAVSVPGRHRVRRARVPAGGRRALGAPRRARRRPRNREALDCDRGVCGQRHRRGPAPVCGIGRLARALTARHAPPHLHLRRARGPLAAVTRGQRGSRRALWAAALATFAVSALHLSQFHQGDASWPVELVGHHASLPLAFAILYQDYPFALADLFLKRALALLALVALAFVAIAAFGLRSTAFAQFVQLDPRQVGILVTLWVTTALLYPALRRVIAWFVDTILLRRPDYRSLRWPSPAARNRTTTSRRC